MKIWSFVYAKTGNVKKAKAAGFWCLQGPFSRFASIAVLALARYGCRN
jgi:hypothetical protein